MRKRVLVAEDYEDVRKMMKQFFEHDGFEVLEAADGYEAVQKAVAEDPDLIIMDTAMPVMDGIQATTAIRQHEHMSDVPIVAVTAYADFYCDRARRGMQRRCAEAGRPGEAPAASPALCIAVR